MQDKADAVAQVETLRAALATRDDVVNSETKNALGSLGFAAEPVAVNNGANTLIPLYHAFDGRTIHIPFYQVEKALTRRFTKQDDVAAEYVGKQVWVLSPEQVDRPETGSFQCRLSPAAPEDIKAEITAAGLTSSCRKKLKYGGFRTQFEADEHFRKRHGRRWTAYQDWRQRNALAASGNQMAAAIEVLTKILEQQKTGA